METGVPRSHGNPKPMGGGGFLRDTVERGLPSVWGHSHAPGHPSGGSEGWDMAMGGGGCHAPLSFHRQPAPTLPRRRTDVRKGAICRLCTSPWRRSRASLRGSARGELAAESRPSLPDGRPLLRAGAGWRRGHRGPRAMTCLSRLGSVNAVIKISTGSHAWDRK